MSHFLPLLLLLSPAALLFLQLPSPCTSLPLRLNLTHIDSKFPNLSFDERNLRAIKRGLLRMEFISSRLLTSSLKVRTTIHYSNAEYIADFEIGTPPVKVTAIIDTSSDLIWTKCSSGSSYNSFSSSTYFSLPCDSGYCVDDVWNDGITFCPDGNSTCSFSIRYGTASIVGAMATETFSFGGTNVPGLAFGCSNSESGTATKISGILGLNEGQLSLVSQLSLENFSYCLTSYEQSLTSSLLLGSSATLDHSFKSTPLIQYDDIPAFYFLSLEGITVGETPLNISSSVFKVSSDGGGFIIDSGTSFTFLVPAAYKVLKQEFQSQLGLTMVKGDVLDMCFSSPSDGPLKPPKLIFHFDGADIDLPEDNYLITDAGGNMRCVAILENNDDISVFGNYQQQNMLITYDIEGGKLYFKPAKCKDV